ncbi:CRTAC1 family protein [Acidobacteria bacterium AH-259-O06]|nr:CRTAC1 family protein [Acidobacteria bacterium AH-259-O06]
MRPITAGGFIDDAPVVFTDIAEQTGLNEFIHRSGSKSKPYILDVPSGGVALFDYDRDGWLDIYLVNGSTYEALEGKENPPRAALFHNNRDGTFTDVTSRAGVANEKWGFGAAVGDFDKDGWPDLYVTNFGANRLYRNNGDGTFTDVAEKAGTAAEVWSTAASFGDFNRDGYLDLFVTSYLEFDPSAPPNPSSLQMASSFCQFRGKPVMCGPRGLKGTPDFLFLNKGDGTFAEVASQAGVNDPHGYYGFATAWVDVDNDGWLDLAVANDSTPNFLYQNKRDGTFEDISFLSGFALNENGVEQAGMGLAIGDYDNDGWVDFYVTNFSDDYNTLYRNEGEAFFMDVTNQLRLGDATIPFLGWGTGFLDFDNDGFKDLFIANGHVYAGVDEYNWGTTWAQRPLLFRNLEGKRFGEVPPATGSGLAIVVPARGAAFGDLNNDGRVDVVLNCIDGTPRVLQNKASANNNWILLHLIGADKSPRDAIGATVFVTADGKHQRGDVISGGSYSSHSDLRLHFGLGQAERVEKVEIRWPSGKRETRTDLPVNRILTIREE